MKNAVKNFLVMKHLTVKEAMRQMSEIGSRHLFVIDEKEKLFGSLSDGDIRRWILKNGHLKEHVENVCNRQPRFVGRDYDANFVRKEMLKFKIVAIPVVDQSGLVCEVLTWDQVFAGKTKKHTGKLNIPVVIMAGGKGTRLDPFTRILPKPLIPIGEKPILQIIMDKLKEHGVRVFFLTLNHKAKMIRSYFEEYSGHYRIHYIEEKKPLGTIGSLRLLKSRLKNIFLVTNCDIIIDVDYSEIIKFHKNSRFDITIVVSCKRYVIPYGVCEVQNDGLLKHIQEKPEYDLLVNTGMYIMNSRILNLIPAGKPMGSDELIEKAKSEGLRVGVFPVDEKSWIDIGQWEEYRKATGHLHTIIGE